MPGPLVIAAGAAVLGLGALTASVTGSGPFRNEVEQRLYPLRPNQLLNPEIYAELRRRGLIEPYIAKDELLKLGLDTAQRDHLYNTTIQLLGPYDYIAAWRRGAYDRRPLPGLLQFGDMPLNEVTDPGLGYLYDKLYQAGYELDEIRALLQLSEARPNVQDIITFAVREVYSPEIAQANRQYEGADEVYRNAAEDLRAQGLTQDRFRKYWAAHWHLPSIQQGYEMLHRDIIDGERLDQLMVALDIMPGWRDQLKAISYSPYTRVDVRRMHKYGVLQDEDLIRTYKDLGYDEDKAQHLADFTRAYNADPTTIDETEEDLERKSIRDLTKTDLLKGYRDQLLTGEYVRTTLWYLGYEHDEIDYYLARVDYEREQDYLDQHLKWIHTGYLNGTYDRSTVVVKLGELDLPGKMGDQLLTLWDQERAVKVERPTKAELLRWVRKGLLTFEEGKAELLTLGYPPRWAEMYLREVSDEQE